jgi:hypothetical protein
MFHIAAVIVAPEVAVGGVVQAMKIAPSGRMVCAWMPMK